MIHYAHAVSPLLLLSVLLLLAVVPATLLLVLVRHARAPESLRREHDVVAATFTVVGSLYGVLLAFMVMTVSTQYSATLAICESEGSALANLHRDSYGLPAASQVSIRQALIDYAHAVIEDEWPALRHRQDCPKATAAMDGIWKLYHGVKPGDERERAWLQQSISGLNELAGLRRMRILASQDTLGWMMWLLLIAGGVVTTGFMTFFGVERFRSHLILTLSLAGLIVLILSVVCSLDNPYWGEPRINPTSFLRFLAHHPTPE